MAKDISKLFEDGVEIERAFARAARQAMIEHKALGLPMAEWRDGAVVWIPPEDLEIPAEDS